VGAPRIHGELLKLGVDIGETSVGRYMAVRSKYSKALLNQEPEKMQTG
jgi:hypothetical protein